MVMFLLWWGYHLSLSWGRCQTTGWCALGKGKEVYAGYKNCCTSVDVVVELKTQWLIKWCTPIQKFYSAGMCGCTSKFQRLGVGHIVSFFPVVLLLLMFPCSPRRLSNRQLHASLEDVQFLHPINSDSLWPGSELINPIRPLPRISFLQTCLPFPRTSARSVDHTRPWIWYANLQLSPNILGYVLAGLGPGPCNQRTIGFV
jgi:hypothetical protein